MPNVTENYGLKKPLPEEFYDINVQNENMDVIDSKLKELADFTPDVSGEINTHNTSGSAHADIRTAVSEAKQSASQALIDAKSYTDVKMNGVTAEQVGAIPTSQKGVAMGVATLDSDGKVPTGQLPEISSVKTYTATIGTSWTENQDTGVKSQKVVINGVTAEHTAKVDHIYTGNGSSDSYATFVKEENQYLEFITNGYAETYDGGITFYIFGGVNTVNIPIVVEVA